MQQMRIQERTFHVAGQVVHSFLGCRRESSERPPFIIGCGHLIQRAVISEENCQMPRTVGWGNAGTPDLAQSSCFHHFGEMRVFY